MTDGRPPQAGVLKASVTGGHAGGARALKAVIQFLAKIGGRRREEGVIFFSPRPASAPSDAPPPLPSRP